jgi:hypothetical protein
MYLFAAAAMARAATGKPDLVAPDAVLLYTHADLKDTDFVEPLVCAPARARRSARISQLLASPTHSTARLETNDPSLSRRERAQVLALRAYKLIIDCAGGGVPRRAALGSSPFQGRAKSSIGNRANSARRSGKCS